MGKRVKKRPQLPGYKPGPGPCVNHVWLVMGEGEPHVCANCGEEQRTVIMPLGNQKPTTPCREHNWKEYPSGSRECLSCGKQEACPDDDEKDS